MTSFYFSPLFPEKKYFHTCCIIPDLIIQWVLTFEKVSVTAIYIQIKSNGFVLAHVFTYIEMNLKKIIFELGVHLLYCMLL